MATKVKGIKIEFGGDTTGITKALKDIDKQARSIQGELRSVDYLLKLDPKNTELLAQKQKLLSDNISVTKDKLESLKKAKETADNDMKNGTEVNEQQYRKLQREIVETEQKLKGLESKTEETKVKFDALGKNAEKMNDAMKKAGLAAIGAGAGIVAMGMKAAAAADDINTLSTQTGLSTEQIQIFQYASERIDVSLDTLTGSMAKLTKNMYSAQQGSKNQSEAFKALGVNITDNNGKLRNNQDVMNDCINALGKMENETQRDAYAMQIFGKSAQDLNPLILGGADALKKMGKEAKAAGVILDQDTLDSANRLNDAVDKMKATATGAFSKIGAEIAEDLTPYIEPLSDMISDVVDTIVDNKEVVCASLAAIGTGLLAFNVTSMIQGVVSSIQQLTKATEAATAAQKLLNLAQSGNGLGLLLGAISAVVGGLIVYQSQLETTESQFNKFKKEINDGNQAWKDLLATQQEAIDTAVSQADSSQSLADELRSLADESGNVKDKDKDRAEFILKELNEALGTEYTMTGNQIDRYKDLQKEIDLLIAKKKAEIMLEQERVKYEEAYSQKQEKIDEQIKLMERMAELQEKINELEESRPVGQAGRVLQEELKRTKDNLEECKQLYQENAEAIDSMYEEISQYQQDYQTFLSNDTEKINEMLNSRVQNFKVCGDATNEELSNQAQYFSEYYAKVLQRIAEGDLDINSQQVKDAQTIAKNALEEYKKAGGNIPEGLKQGIMDGTPQTTAEAAAFADLVLTIMRMQWGINSPSTVMASYGGYLLEGLWNGMDDKTRWLITQIQSFCSNALGSIKKFFGIESPSKVMRDEVGKMIDEGMAIGITKNLDTVKKSFKDLFGVYEEEHKDLTAEETRYNEELDRIREAGQEKANKAYLDGLKKAAENAKKQRELIRSTYKDMVSDVQKEIDNLNRSMESFKNGMNDVELFREKKTSIMDTDGSTITLSRFELSDLSAKKKELETFRDNIINLKNIGIDEAMIEQIKKLGGEKGGQLAQALLEATPEQRDLFINDFKEIGELSGQAMAEVFETEMSGVAEKTKSLFAELNPDLLKIGEDWGKVLGEGVLTKLKETLVSLKSTVDLTGYGTRSVTVSNQITQHITATPQTAYDTAVETSRVMKNLTEQAVLS